MPQEDFNNLNNSEFTPGVKKKIESYWFNPRIQIDSSPNALTPIETANAIDKQFKYEYNKNPKKFLLKLAGDGITIRNPKTMVFLEGEILQMKKDVTSAQNYARWCNNKQKISTLFNEPVISYTRSVVDDINTKVKVSDYLLKIKYPLNDLKADYVSRVSKLRNGITLYHEAVGIKKTVGLVVGVPMAVATLMSADSVVDQIKICNTHIGNCYDALVDYNKVK